MKKIYLFSMAFAIFSIMSLSSFAVDTTSTTAVTKTTYSDPLKEALKQNIDVLNGLREEDKLLDAQMRNQEKTNASIEADIHQRLNTSFAAEIKATNEIIKKINEEIKSLQREKKSFIAQYVAAVKAKNTMDAKVASDKAAAIDSQIKAKKTERISVVEDFNLSKTAKRETWLKAKGGLLEVRKIRVQITTKNANILLVVASKDGEWIKYEEANIADNTQGKIDSIANIIKFKGQIITMEKEVLELRKGVETQLRATLASI